MCDPAYFRVSVQGYLVELQRQNGDRIYMGLQTVHLHSCTSVRMRLSHRGAAEGDLVIKCLRAFGVGGWVGCTVRGFLWDPARPPAEPPAARDFCLAHCGARPVRLLQPGPFPDDVCRELVGR